MDQEQSVNNLPSNARGPETFIEHCKSVRGLLLAWGDSVLKLKKHSDLKPLPEGSENDVNDRGEAIANIMLAYRHMEDARMRVGKAIQAMEGGKSIYDK